MCGIVGIYSTKLEIEKELILKMNDAIVRRGPDDEGYYSDDSISLGMRRLSIIDISSGHQPIFNEDGSIVIVFNGEIYNHNELRKDLLTQGHIFKTKSDTEVIVHLYEQHGIDFLHHLRGMFGICIWDNNRNTGYLCRDHFGIKPIYTAMSDDGYFMFGSELKSIIATKKIAKKIAPQGLDAYLAYNYIPAPLTIYEGIYKLPAAHYIQFGSGKVSKPIRYWDANSITAAQAGTFDEIDAGIQESITYHMESDVPVGAFLSGGIDSSLVTAIASAHEKFGPAYTIGFDDVKRIYDERPLAKLVSTRYKIENHQLISIKPDPEKLLTEAILAFDEPFADDSIIPTWEICKLAAKDVKVCLTGLGGDELFGGYYRYAGIKLYESYSKMPLSLRKAALTLAQFFFPKPDSRKLDHMMRFLNASVLPSDEVYISYLTSLTKEKRSALYTTEISATIDFESTIELIKQHFSACKSDSLLQKAIYTDINTYVPEDILTLSDRVSMWHSLELRVPLMDRILFTMTYGLADKYKIDLKDKKILLRKIAKKYLPEELFSAKKQGFESPMAEWINNELKDFVDQKLSTKEIEKHNFFDAAFISSLLQEHRQKLKDNTKLIFSLLMFQIWHEVVFTNE